MEKNSVEYEGAYSGARNTILSIFFGLLLIFVGMGGVIVLLVITTSLIDGTATISAIPAGIFGVGAVAFSVYELYQL